MLGKYERACLRSKKFSRKGSKVRGKIGFVCGRNLALAPLNQSLAMAC